MYFIILSYRYNFYNIISQFVSCKLLNIIKIRCQIKNNIKLNYKIAKTMKTMIIGKNILIEIKKISYCDKK
jgi:hypothetical protein